MEDIRSKVEKARRRYRLARGWLVGALVLLVASLTFNLATGAPLLLVGIDAFCLVVAGLAFMLVRRLAQYLAELENLNRD